MTRRHASLFLCSAVATMLLAGPAASETCFVAKVMGPATATNGSAVFILSDDESIVTFNIACCNACHVTAGLQIVSDIEGLLFNIASGSCPAKGEWTSTDAVPLTPARVQALKDGQLSLLVQEQSCLGAVAGSFLPASCE